LEAFSIEAGGILTHGGKKVPLRPGKKKINVGPWTAVFKRKYHRNMPGDSETSPRRRYIKPLTTQILLKN
jgi:hypothetical protein